MYEDGHSSLENLDPKQAIGYDNIPSKVFKSFGFPTWWHFVQIDKHFYIRKWISRLSVQKFTEVSAQYKTSYTSYMRSK